MTERTIRFFEENPWTERLLKYSAVIKQALCAKSTPTLFLLNCNHTAAGSSRVCPLGISVQLTLLLSKRQRASFFLLDSLFDCCHGLVSCWTEFFQKLHRRACAEVPGGCDDGYRLGCFSELGRRTRKEDPKRDGRSELSSVIPDFLLISKFEHGQKICRRWNSLFKRFQGWLHNCSRIMRRRHASRGLRTFPFSWFGEIRSSSFHLSLRAGKHVVSPWQEFFWKELIATDWEEILCEWIDS